MPNITLTNLTATPVNLRDLYLTLAPGATVQVFRSSDQLMAMRDLHHEIANATVLMNLAFTADEVASNFDPFPGVPAVPPTVPVPSYGELFVQSAIGIAVPIPTAGTFVKWNTTIAGVNKGAPYVAANTGTHDLTVGASGAGVYKINAHCSFEGPNTEVFKWAVFINGVIRPDLRSASTIPTGSGDRTSVALSGLATLAAADVLDYRVTSISNGVTCLVFAANLNLIRIE